MLGLSGKGVFFGLFRDMIFSYDVSQILSISGRLGVSLMHDIANVRRSPMASVREEGVFMKRTNRKRL